MDDLVGTGSFTPELSEFMRPCVQAKLNLIISGGTGSGKTTLLNALSGFIPMRSASLPLRIQQN